MFNFIKSLNPFAKKQKVTSQILDALEKYVEASEKDPKKTFIIVEFVKKDQKVVFAVREITSLSVKLGETIYYLDKLRLDSLDYNRTVQNKTKKYIIPRALIYEGITACFTPYEDINDPGFTERFQKAMYLEIKTGIMEAKRKEKMDLRKTIAVILIGLTVLYLVVKWLGGGA